MEIATLEPQVTKSLTLPLEEVMVLPIGDIQYGAEGCDLDRLKRHLEWGLKHGAYFTGMGDYMDVASPSNRKVLMSARPHLYDSVRAFMEEAMHEKLNKLWPVLEPTKGRWLGLVSGHHLWPFEDGSTTDTVLASRLECPYMGDGAALVILQFNSQLNGTTKRTSYGTARIWFHHGVGMGQTMGAALNRLQWIMQRFMADVYLIGHLPQTAAAPMPFLDYDVLPSGRIIDRSRVRRAASTGGFLKSYFVGGKNAFGYPEAGYGEKAMYPPTQLGGVVVYIRPRIKDGRVKIDTNISV
jgi:hypothetical protein